jgi:GNAT superfamily N-acetyltransferase
MITDELIPAMQRSATIFSLEMLDRDAFCPKVAPPGFEVTMVDPADPEVNRQFYCLVGALWKWTDRLKWSSDDWQRYVHRDSLRTWIGRVGDQSVGYFELESQRDGNVEIAYFGLLPDFIGRGFGGPLLSVAIDRAWNLPDTRRLWVHTCTDDHKHALENYRRRGFSVFRIQTSHPRHTDRW